MKAAGGGGRVFIGTSGWAYGHWRDRFYPREIPSTAFLDFYAGQFHTTEVNYSFYQLPRPQTFATWTSRVPESFIFAVKAPRVITHLKRLQGVEAEWHLFVNHALALGTHLGPILVQLPPTFIRHDQRLRDFLVMTARLPVRVAFEFRHVSWLTEPVYELLREYRAALCLADSARRPRVEVRTTDFVYLRFHGRASTGTAPCYSEGELEREARKIAEYRRAGADVFAYFNNDAHAHAISNARDLERLCKKWELISGAQMA